MLVKCIFKVVYEFRKFLGIRKKLKYGIVEKDSCGWWKVDKFMSFRDLLFSLWRLSFLFCFGFGLIDCLLVFL